MIATEPTRTRRPQLNETIAHLNDVIDGLSTAVPEVVADALREALGAGFATAVGRAVADALAPRLRDLVAAEVAAVRAELAAPRADPTPVLPPPTEVKPPAEVRPPEPPTPTLAARLRAQLTGAKAWAGRQLDAVLGVAAIGWTMLRLLGVAVAHSPAAAISAVAAALAFGVVAAVTDPAVGVVLAAVSAGTLTAVGVAAAPLVRVAADLVPDGGR